MTAHRQFSPHSDHLAKQLLDASYNGRDSEVLDLLRSGVDPNYRRIGLRTPLMWACSVDLPLTAELLLKWGARVGDVRGENNWTA